MPFDFKDRRVLVTGGSRGIGRATAAAFLKAGARVAVNGSSAASTQAGLDALAKAAPAEERLVAAPGDIGTVAGCQTAVAAAVEALGGLDILVNNAGVAVDGPMEEVTEADWDRVQNVNLKGTFFAIQAALPALRSSGGVVVNLASDAGLIGEAGLAVYCASKGGVANLTRALALELAPRIRVNCICPGYVDTDMVRADLLANAVDPDAAMTELAEGAALKRVADPEEIAGGILYLASDLARNVTGAALSIDGGTTAGQTPR